MLFQSKLINFWFHFYLRIEAKFSKQRIVDYNLSTFFTKKGGGFLITS
jgi:hypothetical protein